MTRIAPQAIASVVGAAASTALGGNPLAGALITKALEQILADRSEELKQLDQVKADTQALVRGPYNTGMDWLEQAAQPYRSIQERDEFICKARDEFVRARGQEQNQYSRALIEYHLGNCWTLLGSNKDAQYWFQRAHKSAIEYLRESVLRAKWYELRPELGVGDAAGSPPPPLSLPIGLALTSAKAVGGVVLAGAGAVVPGLQGPGAGLVKWAAHDVAYRRSYRAYRQSKKEFREEARPALHLIDALEQLRYQASGLALEFEEPSPAQGSLEEWVKGR